MIRKKHITTSALLATTIAASTLSYAESNYRKPYTSPSRGFFLEHGSVNAGEYVSVELHSGADNFDSGGSIRLGLPNAELILNSGLNIASAKGNDALVKYRLPPIKSGEQQTTDQFQWAFLAGLSVVELDGSTNDQTNLKIGLAASLSAEIATFTISPSIIYSNIANNNDTYLELDLGAYAGVIDTESGLFSVGAEVNMSSQDDQPNTAFEEGGTTVALGARWAYNEKINIDIIPVVISDRDLLGVPGLIRLNVVF